MWGILGGDDVGLMFVVGLAIFLGIPGFASYMNHEHPGTVGRWLKSLPSIIWHLLDWIDN